MKSWAHFIKQYRLIISVIFLLVIAYLIYFYFYFSKITDNAFVFVKSMPIASEIDGKVTKINVANGQMIKQGDIIFSIDPKPYQLKISELKAQALAINNKIKELNYKVQHVQGEDKLLQALLIETEKSRLSILKEKIKQAQLKLKDTKVVAPSDGFVTNFSTISGALIKAYQPIGSFLSTNTWWVQANFKETDLVNVKKGDKATIRLRMYLGKKVYHGIVESSHWAVSRRISNTENALQKINNDNQWVLPAQRFPVLIRVINPDENYPLLPGASAYVSIDS
ncbi:HlyD family secretion protein [Thiotrichales bacterium 19S11-10]|nr:HlyD family secretion protein [Thiotrichales bacterium 19S11-10]MCF6807349.1 HlyD family secretion protein [Thiotrichales bacterium 19S9-11]MCF6811318.1 HlyD family secretion protein [Thiotrichales bacterium 19S9-12]